MGFKPLKLLGKLAGSLIPGVGVVADIIAPGKTQQEKNDGLAMLVPIAQYNRTMARPRIAIMITGTYLLGIIIRWVQQLCGIHTAYLITIPPELGNFATIVVTTIVGGRGIQKIVGAVKTVLKKGKKK